MACSKGSEMIPLDPDSRRGLAGLFQGYQWNYLPDAVLEGHAGEAKADSEDNPQVAVLEISKLKLFILGGDPNHPATRGYLENLPRKGGR